MRRHRIPHAFLLLTSLAATGLTAPVAAQAVRATTGAANPDPAVVAALRREAGGDVKRFYAERGYRPLWVRDGRIGGEADRLIAYLDSADLDGLRPTRYRTERLRAALVEARGGTPRALARAEVRLSDALARYVRDQRSADNDAGMIYADRALEPRTPKADAILRAAAFPASFAAYVEDMAWMSPHYVRLRELAARAGRDGASPAARDRLARNLDRARLLPGPFVRHVVVDASSGRLWYYEAGKQAGTMRVVVGAPETPTPLLAGYLQWAILNPYWNVPTYLARKSIAPRVLAGRSLAAQKIEALSDWGPSARKLAQSEIDWRAVAAGTLDVRLRELPGPHNAMGKVKFLFPNDEGIYLHDTPERTLLRREDRHLSNGCIRLEDATAFGRWLFHKPLRASGNAPEQAVHLPVQVPVYLTYLTPAATERGIAFRDDVYGLDGDGRPRLDYGKSVM